MSQIRFVLIIAGLCLTFGWYLPRATRLLATQPARKGCWRPLRANGDEATGSDDAVRKSATSRKLKDLIEHGIPMHNFFRDGPLYSAHFSDHNATNNNGTDSAPFGIVQNIEALFASSEELDEASLLLTALKHSGGIIAYNSEADIQLLVRQLFADALSVSGLYHNITIKAEVALTKVHYLGRGSNRADFWLIMTFTGRPIQVIEVKSPHNAGVLSNARVHGQVWDYLMDVMSFFGQYHVIGVSTTFEETRFHWFPHSDDYVASTADPSQAPRNEIPALDMVTIMNERVLHSSKVYYHTDTNLVPLLVSALVKCLYSPYAPVGMVDEHRAYMRVTADGWQWCRLKQDTVDKLSVRLTALARRSSGFCIVKYFFRSTEKKVWLAIAEPSMQLVAVKVFATPEEAYSERDLWERVNGADLAFCTKLRDSVAMCAPLVIHASEEGNTGRVTFDFDLTDWSRQAGAVPGKLPTQLAAFSAKVKELGGGLDVRDVARRAIERAAKAGVVHKDLAWRHVALMPEFDDTGAVQRLVPVLLDFGRVEDGVEPCVAQREMEQELVRLEADRSW